MLWKIQMYEEYVCGKWFAEISKIISLNRETNQLGPIMTFIYYNVPMYHNATHTSFCVVVRAKRVTSYLSLQY